MISNPLYFMTKITYRQKKEIFKYNCSICNDTGQWRDYTDAFGGSRIVICNCRIAIKENYKKLLTIAKDIYARGLGVDNNWELGKFLVSVGEIGEL
jgi:hypothetical protein